MNPHAYTTKLGEISLGRIFIMCNYKGTYMRIAGEPDLKMLYGVFSEPTSFNDDGCHVPIVELSTGRMTHMAKEKPCYLFGGEEK